MPSDLSSWLISTPQDGDSEGLFQELQGKLDAARVLPKSNIAELHIPSLKAGADQSVSCTRHTDVMAFLGRNAR